MDVWSRGVHEKQIGTRWEYGSPEYLALTKAEKEWKASPRLVPTYFPRPSGDELVWRRSEWSGTASSHPRAATTARRRWRTRMWVEWASGSLPGRERPGCPRLP